MSPPVEVGGVLLLYHRPPRLVADAATVREHIGAFGRYSRFPVHEVNTGPGFPDNLAELEFDAIVLHYSLFVAGPTPYLLGPRFLDYLGESKSHKVAFFQDEHHWCKRRFAFLDHYGFDCVFSCVPEPYLDQVYGAHTQVPTLVSHIPGYVSPDMIEAASRFARPDSKRAIDVGYRGRPLSPRMGSGILEKVEVGRRFAELAAGSGLALDIDLSEEGRLYGTDWYRFVGGSKAMLGVESGTSFMDLEDEVLADAQELEARGEPVTLETLQKGALARWDGNIPYRTISPRHFEAAAFGTTQILFEGEYSGAMRPMEHYIPLRKDFSNFDEVLERFADVELRRELAANARRDLIDSKAYGYDRLIARFDEVLTDAGIEPPAPSRGRALAPRWRPLGRAPLGARLLYGVSGLWEWLHRRHRWAWWPLHVASRPVVLPMHALQRRRAAARAELANPSTRNGGKALP